MLKLGADSEFLVTIIESVTDDLLPDLVRLKKVIKGALLTFLSNLKDTMETILT